MRVTIIIPAYNAENTIERCVRSALGQSWQDLEILVVNDGSTDGTGAVLERMASEQEHRCREQGRHGRQHREKDRGGNDSGSDFRRNGSEGNNSGNDSGADSANRSGQSGSVRLRILEQDNRGVSCSRARGLALAEGEYLTFLDADDYLAPDYIKNFALAAEETRADLYLCGYTEVLADGREREHPPGAVYERGTAEEYAYRMLAACARFYRTDFCRSCGLAAVPGKVRGEDIPVGLRTNYMAERICLVQQCGYYYVQHEASARHQLRGLRRYELPLEEIRRIVQECAEDYAHQNPSAERSPVIGAGECAEAGAQRSDARSAADAEKRSFPQGHWHFLELGVLRVFVTFLWDLGRGAGRERQQAIYEWERDLLRNDLQDWRDNPYLKLFNRLRVPFSQKAAVWLFLQMYRTGWLDFVYRHGARRRFG